MERQQWKGQSRGGAKGNLIFILLIKYLGVGSAYLLLLFVVPYFLLFAPKAVAALWDFYRIRLNYNIFRSIMAIPFHFYRFGQVLIDKTAITMGLSERYKFIFENSGIIEEMLQSSSPMVVVGAHFGNWECGLPFFDKYGKAMNIVMFEAEHEKIKRVMEENSLGKSYKIIPAGRDLLSSMLHIKCALDKGECVCMQGDRFLSSQNSGANANARNFLGHNALFPAGPFLLPKRLGVPLCFYFAIRSGHKEYTFKFINADRNSPEEHYIKTLENLVRENPSQWFNFYKFWQMPTSPLH